MRSRLPSCTLTCTRSVSPGSKRGTGRSACTLSIVAWASVSRMFIATVLSSLPVVCLRRAAAVPQVGPPPPRNLLPLPHSPLGNLAVVARDQNLRHAPFDSIWAGPARWGGLLRVLQQPALETPLARRCGLAHDAGQQPHTAIHHRHGRDLAT